MEMLLVFESPAPLLAGTRMDPHRRIVRNFCIAVNAVFFDTGSQGGGQIFLMHAHFPPNLGCSAPISLVLENKEFWSTATMLD